MKIVNTNEKFYNPVFLFLIIAIFLLAIIHPWEGNYYNSLISWDKLGYYLYLPVTFIYKDWFSLKFISEYFNHYQPSSYWYQTLSLPNGNQVASYPVGVAIVQFPFFILGYISALLFNYKLDGFSEPFVVWIYISGLIFGLKGIYYSYKSLNYFFNRKLSYFSVVLLFTGTNLFYYCFWDSIMPHAYLFGLYSIVIYNTIRWHQTHQFSRLLKISICVGLMVSMRATEVIVVIIPLLWGVNNLDSLKEKLNLLFNYKVQLIACILIGAIPFLLQMLYWKAITGHFIFNPYAYNNLGFSWTKPHLFNFLVSFRKGWFIYTPLMILTLGGFYLFIKKIRYKDFALGFILFSAINLYILSSWDIWWYGGSYGQRAMTQSYSIYVFAIAALLEWVRGKHIFSYGIYFFIGLCILLNISFTWQYAYGRINTDGITKGMFKEYLLNPRFGDIKEKERPYEDAWRNDFVKGNKLLYSYNISEDTTVNTDSIENAALINPNSFTTLYEPATDSIINNAYKWIRCSFEMKHNNTEPLYLNNLVLVAEVKGYKDDTRSWVGKSFHYLFKEKKDFNVWKKCVADFEIPATFRSCDKLKFYFWMSSNEKALIRDVKFYSLELKD